MWRPILLPFAGQFFVQQKQDTGSKKGQDIVETLNLSI
jgi:hypothetical protein